MKESLTSFAQWQNSIYAVLLIVILIIAPEGLAGALSRLVARARAVKKEASA